jgi:spermidine/putrescine ABC transporter ATP-binding subunit
MNEAQTAGNEAAYVILDHLVKNFDDLVAVDDFSLEISKGEFVTFLGPSGSGKTTTLNMMAGFLDPTAGEIYLAGETLTSKPPHKRDIGMVFQNYAIFPHMTVFDNIAFPLKIRKLPSGEIAQKVKDSLDLVKLPGYEDRYPDQLSGGQQQRIALARAVVFSPSILLMDEPLGALDKKLREHMQLEIKHIQQNIGITVIYVTHDQSEALTMSDRIVVMDYGKIQQIGTAEDLYERPVNRFVADFIGETNLLEGRVDTINNGVVTVITDKGVQAQVHTPRAFSPGQSVDMAIRPERIFFVEDERPGINVQAGVVKERIYIGEIVKYVVVTSEGEELNLKVPNQLSTRMYQAGDQVCIGWQIDDVRLV